MYFARNIEKELRKWKVEDGRKPLILRGARQVGKSSVVRQFAREFDYFVEINFESDKEVHKLFDGNLDPHEICRNLSVVTGVSIVPGRTLIFFDEIQSCVPAISSLRFFYEQYSDIHLIAAGSLLEFALEKLPSFGVGRVRSLFVYPFSFDEFLSACGEKQLLEAKNEADIDHPLHEVLHEKLLGYLKQFLVIGGMPEVVAAYAQNRDYMKCQAVLDDLIISLKDDFVKYKKRVPSLRINDIFNAVVHQQGGKFVYAKAVTDSNHKQIREVVELLAMAGLIIPVMHTAANGIPLGAQADPKRQKMIVFDTAILQRLLGLKMAEVLLADTFDAINKGAIAEQFVGLELMKAENCFTKPQLWYWHRENPNSSAEVDYVIDKEGIVFPVEVKSGKKGSMQSLYLFLEEKRLDRGIRLSLENFGRYDRVDVYPLYAAGKLIENQLSGVITQG
jgi:uncharacterized protein